ncbi:MAG TPA: N-acetyl-gamma-glutamyl-phosphate reductase, partial [Solirubrobacteraceae bacterium]
MASARVAIVGAAGFAGAIAARIVHRHPALELAAVTARGDDVGRRLDDLYPHHRVPLELVAVDALPELDAAIVCYPHAAAAPVVADLRKAGVVVVDLSADFRLRDRAAYEAWYGP